MSHEPNPIPEPDDFADRLIDASLREVLGGADSGNAPPDLSQRILSAASEASPAKAPAPAALIPQEARPCPPTTLAAQISLQLAQPRHRRQPNRRRRMLLLPAGQAPANGQPCGSCCTRR